MKRLLLVFWLVYGLVAVASAQLTLDECVDLARENYPQIQEQSLIDEAEKYDVGNVNLQWVPQLNITGKASYQSDVVEMPFDIPGFEFDLPHDQYSLVGELTQSIWDGGSSSSQKRLIKANAEVQRKQLDVSLYALRSRVENVYLGILLIDKQLEQNRLLEESLLRNQKEVKALMESGMAYQSDFDMVEVNLLNCRQKAVELNANRMAYVTMLGKLTGKDMSQATFLEPNSEINLDSIKIQRPELALYDAQLQQNQAQRQSLQSNISPKFNLSLQGGIGRPGLNMLKNEFAPYYVAGIRMQWNFGALYTRQNDIHKIATEKRNVEVARETFVFNTMLDIIEQVNNIKKAQQILEQDKEIVRLRASIRTSGEEQYANGVIKMTELMDMIDDEHDARLAEAVHEIQLWMAVCQLKDSMGK